MTTGVIVRKIWQTIKRIPLFGYLAKNSRHVVFRFLPKSVVIKLHQQTDWKKLDIEIERFLSGGEKGTVESTRTPKIIVSLTSYPARIPRIHYTIFTLLRQFFQPDMVILWLGEEHFPNRDDDLTAELLAMRNHGLTIRYTHDTKSHTKLIPALAEFPNDLIITVDDDILYDNKMVEILYRSYEKNPDWIHAHQIQQFTVNTQGEYCSCTEWKWCDGGREGCFKNFLLGVGGVLYPPSSLHEDVANENLFMELAPTADDIWFWAMAVLKGTKICAVNGCLRTMPNPSATYEEIIGTGLSGLCEINILGGQNDIQFNRVLEWYPAIQEKLRQEMKSSRA